MKITKLLLSIALLMALYSCQTDKAVEHIREYVMKSSTIDASKVKDMDIVYEDSLLSPIPAELSIYNLRAAQMAYNAGRISSDSLATVTDHCMRYYLAINRSWNIDPSDAKREVMKRLDLLRAYRVTVKFEDGTTRSFRVIMNEIGTKPIAIESEVQQKIDELGQLINNSPIDL